MACLPMSKRTTMSFGSVMNAMPTLTIKRALIENRISISVESVDTKMIPLSITSKVSVVIVAKLSRMPKALCVLIAVVSAVKRQRNG